MMPQPRHWGVFSLPQAVFFTVQLGCMSIRFLVYMDFVLAVFPLKYGFIIVQVCVNNLIIYHIHGVLIIEFGSIHRSCINVLLVILGSMQISTHTRSIYMYAGCQLTV